jgi:hypothetical protein
MRSAKRADVRANRREAGKYVKGGLRQIKKRGKRSRGRT